jgi:hypothetical protein
MLQGVPNLAVVFVNVIDPVGQRFVTSLAKPGGNATGLSAFEFDFSGKWLELLKEIAPTHHPRRRHSRSDARLGDRSVRRGAKGRRRRSGSKCPIDARDASEMERGSRRSRAPPMAV